MMPPNDMSSPAHPRDTEALAAALAADTSDLAGTLLAASEPDRSRRFMAALREEVDPSRAKIFTPWLTQRYLAGEFTLDNAEMPAEALSLFMAIRPDLPAEEADINRHATISDLLIFASKTWHAHQSKKNIHRTRMQDMSDQVSHQRARMQSDILREDDDGFLIVVPMTSAAADWWGKDTSWPRWDRSYALNMDTPWIIAIIPEFGPSGKFLLRSSADAFTFVDAQGAKVTKEMVETHWVRFAAILSAAFAQEETALLHMPPDLLSPVIMRLAVGVNGRALAAIPDRLISLELCDLAISDNPLALEMVPVRFKSAELCRKAVAGDPSSLQWVPDHIISPILSKDGAFLLRSLSRDGMLLQHIARKRLTETLCEVAIQSNPFAIQFVPGDLLTSAMCLKAAAHYIDGAIRVLPRNMVTLEIVMAAVQGSASNLEHVPFEMRSQEVCVAATRASDARSLWGMMEHVPPSLQGVVMEELTAKGIFLGDDADYEDDAPENAASWNLEVLARMRAATQRDAPSCNGPHLLAP